MQKLKVFFAVFILIMSLMPCADAFMEDDCTEHSLLEQHDEHPDSEDDHCTPFCSCACCQVTSQHPDMLVAQSIQESAHYVDLWQADLLASPSFRVWQPPRA